MAEQAFSNFDCDALDGMAKRHGFKRKGARNWHRRTTDFLQLVNLQRSQWSRDVVYLNFAMWPLALGEPPTLSESKFHFRTRAESMGAFDLASFFAVVDELNTLDDLREAEESGRISCLITKDLRALFD